MRIWKQQLLLILVALVVTAGFASAAMAKEHMSKRHMSKEYMAESPMAEGSMVETGAYINGGVGIDGRHALRAERRHYNLHLAFAQARSGEYLAGVTVTIRQLGSNEAPVRYEDSGPMLYVKLPPGRYHIRAEYRGKRQELTTAVNARGTDRVMYWN